LWEERRNASTKGGKITTEETALQKQQQTVNVDVED
jgi:hypothetical protein